MERDKNPPSYRDINSLINRCITGDIEARIIFQHNYGSLIYTFPVRIHHLPEEKAGDFYLYVFEKERIFKKISSFSSKNGIQFETYLSYYILHSLFLDWTQTLEPENTISLDMPLASGTTGDGETKTLQDMLSTAEPAVDHILVESDALREVIKILRQLCTEQQIVLKLLAFGSIDLGPDDIRWIAQMASRTIRETLDILEEIAEGLCMKTLRIRQKQETLYTVAYWIYRYQCQAATLEEKIDVSRFQGA
jgi:hypothetical protein